MFMSLLNCWMAACGSAPGDNTNTRGQVGEDCAYTRR
jgi:hypothetical protein